MEPIRLTGGKRDYQGAFDTINTEQNTKRPTYEEVTVESLFATQDLAGFSEKILALTGSSNLNNGHIHGNEEFNFGFHLDKVINESPTDQLTNPNWGNYLDNILCSLKYFQQYGLDSLLYCLAKFLSDESKPWLSSQTMSNLFECLSFTGPEYVVVGTVDAREALVESAVRHIQHIDYLSSKTICQVFSFYGIAADTYTNAAVMNVLVPHISRSEPLTHLITWRCFGVRPEPKSYCPAYGAALNAFVKNIFGTKELGQLEIEYVIRFLAMMKFPDNDHSVRDAFLLDLVFHISRVANWYEGKLDRFTNIFSEFYQLPPSPAVDAVIKTFAMRLSSHSQLDLIACIKVLGAVQESGEGVDDMLNALAPHIKSLPKLDSAPLAQILSLLVNIKAYRGVESMMNALESHILGERLDTKEIINILICLKNITSSDSMVERVLCALTQKIDSAIEDMQNTIEVTEDGDLEEEDCKRDLVIFVAEILYGIFSLLQNKSNAATNLFSFILDKMQINKGYPIDRKNSHSPDEQRKIVLDLLRDVKSPELIDLQSMSNYLAKFYLDAILDEFANEKNAFPTLPRLNLVYGKLGTVLYRKALSDTLVIYFNEQQMPAVKKRIFSEVNFRSGEWRLGIATDELENEIAFRLSRATNRLNKAPV